MRRCIRRIGVLVALLLVLGGCGEEDTGESASTPRSGAPPPTSIQAGWPVPIAGSRAAVLLELVSETETGVDLGRETVYGLRYRSWSTVHVDRDPAHEAVEVTRTQGAVRGTIDSQERRRGQSQARAKRPWGGGTRFQATLLGDAGLEGITTNLRLGRGTRSAEPGAACWSLLGVLPPPPADAVLEPGLAWEADAAVPLHPKKLARARFEVEAVEEDRLSVRVAWPMIELSDSVTLGKTGLLVGVSRRDGLALSGTLEASLLGRFSRRRDAESVAVEVRGTVQRLPWVDPPAASPDVDEALRDLMAPEPKTRARAAERLGEMWPRGGRGVAALYTALKDEAPSVRKAAEAAIARRATAGVPTIVAFLRDFDDADRLGFEQAMSTVVQLGAKVTPSHMAGAGVESPPAGAVGLVAIPFEAGRRSRSDLVLAAVWMLDALAETPAVLGPDGYETRVPDLAGACAALLVRGTLPQDPNSKLPDGLQALLASERVGDRMAGIGILWRLGASPSETAKALRALEKDDGLGGFARRAVDRVAGTSPEVVERDRAAVARGDVEVAKRLARAGHGDADCARLLFKALKDPINVILRTGRSRGRGRLDRDVIDLLDALSAIGPKADSATPALKEVVKKTYRRAPAVCEHAVAALVAIAGPSRSRRTLLIDLLRARLESPEFDLLHAQIVFEALAVGADRMEADQREQVAGMLREHGESKELLDLPAVCRLFIAMGPEAYADVLPHLVERLATAADIAERFAGSDAVEVVRPVRPGSERLNTMLMFGARVSKALSARRLWVRMLGASGSKEPAVRTTLERLLELGDRLIRGEAAQALRRLEKP